MSGAVENFDPGSPRYEAARALLVEDLLRIDADAYGEMAEDLKAGDLMRVPSWVAMQVIARLLPTTPPARSYADGVDFRALLIEAGRNAGAYIDDRASDEFLECIPEEVRLKIAALLSQGGKA